MPLVVVQKLNRMTLKDKKIIIVGLARSGAGAANLLAELGASVTVTDDMIEDRERLGRAMDEMANLASSADVGEVKSAFQNLNGGFVTTISNFPSAICSKSKRPSWRYIFVLPSP